MATPSSDKAADYYGEFLAQREEILRYKWVESEKAGHDIGFELALTQWMAIYGQDWRKEFREEK